MIQALRRTALLGLLGVAALLNAACEQERPLYALTTTGRILRFDSNQPTKIRSEVQVTGLGTDESLVQIDYRPSNGTFYGLTNTARLCTVDPLTGAATLIGSTAFTEDDLVNPVMDFNPVVDGLRVIASEQNLRVNPNDGTAATDIDVFYDSGDTNSGRTPRLAGLAYDRNSSNAAATTLFALDITTRSLVRVGSRNGMPDSPNTGRLFTLGVLPVSFTVNSGFDIEPGGDTAYAVLSAAGAGAVLYRVDLDDGTADRVDAIGRGDRTVISLAVGPEKSGGN